MAVVKQWLSRLWLLLLLSFAGWFLYRYPEQLDLGVVGSISTTAYLSSLLCIIIGKVFTVRLVAFTLAGLDRPRKFMFSWWAYSSSDLAKYLPGGIWGISSRLLLYRNQGISLPHASRIFLHESLIIVMVALAVGGGLVGSLLWQGDPFWLPLFYFLLAFVGLLSMRLLLHPLPWRAVIVCATEQVLAWLLFGISFAVLIGSRGDWLERGRLAAGFFDLAFASGFVAFFAPSGIGVREAVLGYASGPLGMTAADVVKLALVHRLVWAVADIALFLPAWVHRLRFGRTNS